MKKYLRKGLFLILSMISVTTIFSMLVSEVVTEIGILKMKQYTYSNGVSFGIEYLENLPKQYEGMHIEDLSDEDIAIADDEFYKKIKQFFTDLMSKEEIVIKVEDGKRFTNGFMTTGLYFNNTYENNYKLIEGRFLEGKDFIDGKKIAVIPEGAVKYAEEIDGVSYINSGTEKYEVVGVIEDGDSDVLEFNTIFFNLTPMDIDLNLSLRKLSLESNIYSNDDLVNIIKKNDYLNIRSFNDIDSGKIKIKQYVSEMLPMFISMYLPVVLVILVTLILSMYYWTNEIKYEVGIKKVCGASTVDILKDVIIRLILVSGFSMIICPIIQGVLESSDILNRSVEYTSTNFILNLIFIIAVCIILIIIVALRIDKIEPVELIKGR